MASMLQIGKGLTSRNAALAFRIFLIIVALGLVIEAIKTAQVLIEFGVEFGTLFWFVCVLKITSSTVSVLCIWMMGRSWAWAVWVWAVSTLVIALTGILIGFKVGSLTQWSIVLPWAVLAVLAMLKSRFAMPWKSGGTGWVLAGVVGLLVCFGASVFSIHKMVATERNAFLEPLKRKIAATNQQLPQMVNEELRLDHVSVDNGGYHQFLTFPQYTVAELESDPGLDFVHDYYAEFYTSLICTMPICKQHLSEGLACSGKFRYELVDMNGEAVISFSLNGSDCQ